MNVPRRLGVFGGTLDPVHDFDVIEDELRRFSAAVAAKPRIVVANKIDALDEPARADALEQHVRALGLPFHRVSGVAGTGLDALLEAMWHAIATAPPPAPTVDTESTEPEAEAEATEANLLTPSRLHRQA